MLNCCGVDACAWFQQNFTFKAEDSAQGVKFTLDVTDPAKATALQNLVKSAREFCQAFCKTGN